MLARLPPHPNLVVLNRLVLDEANETQVVGFTTRYIPSKTLEAHQPPFKLKWLKQLMQTVDDLNLKQGIIHQDVIDRNLIIDPNTDSIVLMDFNVAYRVGIGITKHPGRAEEAKWAGRDDVKGVMLFLYEYITRDPALKAGCYDMSQVDETPLMDRAKWVKHPSVSLDAEVADFYSELMAWVRRRRAPGNQLAHYTEAPQPLEWPSIKEVVEKQGRRKSFQVRSQRRAGLPYLSWTRPSSSKLDPARRLLATGRYADEEKAAQKAMAKAIEASRHNPLRELPPVGRWSNDTAPIIPWEPGQIPWEIGKNVEASAKAETGEKVEAGAKGKAGAVPGPRVLRPRQKRKMEGEGDNEASVIAAPNRAVKEKKAPSTRGKKLGPRAAGRPRRS